MNMAATISSRCGLAENKSARSLNPGGDICVDVIALFK